MQRKVMVIDEEDSLLEAMDIMITQLGNYVIATNKSLIVPQMVGKYKPEIIFIDVDLRETDGRQLCLDLKNSAMMADVRIFLYCSDPEKLSDYKNYKADGTLIKPFTIDQLKVLIQSCSP